jgi:hypothetical protein
MMFCFWSRLRADQPGQDLGRIAIVLQGLLEQLFGLLEPFLSRP